MKRVAITFTGIIIMLSSSIFYFNNKNNNSTSERDTVMDQVKNNQLENLIVKPQVPKNRITVDSVIIDKASYLVIREVVDGALGQIIEISSPLTKGAHKNIQIPLGSADVHGKELIVMIYDDQSTDKTFNDFDQPTIDDNGRMIARYVKTGKPLLENIAEGNSSDMGHNMAGMADMVKVKYTDKGFIPEKVDAPVGSMVEFINESSTEMWVASSEHPSHSDLPTFDQFKATKKGSIYRYVFDKKGTWKYHDHINASLGGIVNVL